MISAEKINKKFDFIFLDFYSVIDEETLPEIVEYSKMSLKLRKSKDSVVMGWWDIHTPDEFKMSFMKFMDN